VILATGSGGLLGSALVRAGARGVTRRDLDVTDGGAVAAVLDALRPEAVVNAAGFTAVNHAEVDPRGAWVVNARAPGVLARLCRARGVHLVHVSTDYVLDSDAPLLDEDAPVGPRGEYARSKLAGERAALDEGATVVRLQWVYRVGHPGFLTSAVDALARGGVVRLVTDQVGCPTPADLVAPALLTCARAPVPGLFHLATGGGVSAWGWVERAAALVGVPLRAEPVTRAGLGGAHRPARSCLDSSRFAATWGVRLPAWDVALTLDLAG